MAEMQKRYYRPAGAVLPLRRYYRALCRATTAKPDTKRAGPKIEAEEERHCSGTTAESSKRYYRLGSRYYPWDQTKATLKKQELP